MLSCDLVNTYQHVISVDSLRGHNNISCLQPNGEPCQTLEYVASKLKSVANNSVLIEICQPAINLTQAVNFTDFVDLSIGGAEGGDPVVILCNTSNAGLSFVNICRLTISFIKLSNCGVKTAIDITLIPVSALNLLNCYDVSITNSIIEESNGTGISIVDTLGDVRIINVRVVQSSLQLKNSNTLYDGGRGVNILLNSSNSTSLCSGEKIMNIATYTINDLKCLRNKVETPTYQHETLCAPSGIGGGALIVLGSGATNISININNSLFQDNYALCGGGMLISFSNFLSNNHVSLNWTTFTGNSVPKGHVGGGLHVVSISPKEGVTYTPNTLKFFSCNFQNNTEGGVNIYSAEILAPADVQAVFFTNCSWIGNSATQYGAAVHIMAGIIGTGTRGHYPSIVFKNCTFVSNRIVAVKNSEENLATQVNAVGTFYSNVLSVVFDGETVFESNNLTALYLSCSIATFNSASNVKFLHNNGTNGGAISLIGRSYLYLNGSSKFSFINNTASHLGGAIYFQSVDTIVYQPCFINNARYNETSDFYFNGNNAFSNRGPHIFASSFASCYLSFCNTSCSGTELFDCLGEFTFENPANKTIGTPPVRFHLNTSHVTLFPGLLQQLSITALDSEGKQVPGVSYQATLAKNCSAIGINPLFQYVSNNTISIVGKPDEKDTLHLNALSTDLSLLINVSLSECPPGYILNKDSHSCECGASYYYGILKCDPEAYIRHGVWMGRCGSEICTADCPVGYCTYNTMHPKLYQSLPMNVSELEGAICHPSREGTICGSCKPNHSVFYNSWNYECREDKQCHLGSLYFILSTILPLTILFLVITLSDTNFANGWNGFILFAQVAKTFSFYGNGTIRYTPTQLKVLGSILYLSDFFNLEFFNLRETQFCIWKGATFMGIQMIKLGSILFAFVLVLIFVCLFNQRKLSRCFPCLSRRRYTVINGISTFLILCYAQCCNTCFKVLTPTCLKNYYNWCVRKVVLYSGDLDANIHLQYPIVAEVFLVFIIVLPPTLLLIYPLFFKLLGFCRLSESRIACFLWRIMPIQVLDSIQNSFKDKYRFFAGLYLLYRALILSVHVNSWNMVDIYAAVQLILAIIVVLHVLLQPYKKRLHNIIDMLLFFDLMILNGIAQYTYAIFISRKESETHGQETNIILWNSMEIFLLVLPFVCAAVYLTIKLLVQLKVWKTMMKKGYRAIHTFT